MFLALEKIACIRFLNIIHTTLKLSLKRKKIIFKIKSLLENKKKRKKYYVEQFIFQIRFNFPSKYKQHFIYLLFMTSNKIFQRYNCVFQ